MNELHFFVGNILPYLTLLIFLGGMIYRIYIWAKLPSPIITLFPRPEKGTALAVVKECFLFPGLFRSDKALWGGAWIFHLMLAFIFLGHFRVLTDFPYLWNKLGMGAEAVERMSAIAGGAAGVIIILAVLFLIFRRIGLKRVREISGLGDYIVMFLILAILLTGNALRFFQHFDLQETRIYFSGLVTFAGTPAPDNGLFLLHFLLAQMLLIFIPFSKMLHLGGIFFSQTILKRS
jgi:nitrate reductase gamma subunit